MLHCTCCKSSHAPLWCVVWVRAALIEVLSLCRMKSLIGKGGWQTIMLIASMSSARTMHWWAVMQGDGVLPIRCAVMS